MSAQEKRELIAQVLEGHSKLIKAGITKSVATYEKLADKDPETLRWMLRVQQARLAERQEQAGHRV